MTTSNLQPGQRVKCNVRGRVFWAKYQGRNDDGTHHVLPEDRRINYFNVKATQIVEAERRYNPYDKLVRRST